MFNEPEIKGDADAAGSRGDEPFESAASPDSHILRWMKHLLRALNLVVYGSIFLVTTAIAFWFDWRYGVALLGLYLGACVIGGLIGWLLGRSAPIWMRAGELILGACRRSRLALGFAMVAVMLAVATAFLMATEDDPLFARIILVGVMTPAAGYGVYYRVRQSSAPDDCADEATPRRL